MVPSVDRESITRANAKQVVRTCVVGVVEIDCPDHRSPKTHVIRSLHLDLGTFTIIVTDPLVTPRDPFDCRYLVKLRHKVVGRDDASYFGVGQCAGRRGAFAGLATRGEFAAGRVAGCVG
jgi:hypothetical protein